ncbi:MAG: aspartate aminotransferase family protein [Alphaproteobacteria bacterium]|nr:aspartate aminotransferase family protein [Alphaproteobacteria bacterium]
MTATTDKAGDPGTRLPKSAGHEKLYERAEKLLPGAGLGSYSLPDDVRFVIKRGKGARLEDVDGNWHIDYVCGAGSQILGHAHPAVAGAIAEQLTQGHQYYGTLNEPILKLAEELVAAIPCAEKVMFTTTGSEATFFSMRLARAFTGRNKILKFEGGYHGNHDYSSFSMFPKARANYPVGTPDTAGIPPHIDENVLVAPFNDLDTTRRLIEEHRADLAAVICEPLQRIVMPKAGFLEGLRKVCTDNDVLLIFDEMVSGFRLAYGGGQEYFGVKADIGTYGKIISGGGPLCAIAASAEIIELANPRRKGEPNYVYINGTLHGSPIAAVAGLATLNELKKPGFHANLAKRSDDFRKETQKVLDRHGIAALSYGHASYWQILFTDHAPESALDVVNSDMASARRLDLESLRHGIYNLPGVRRYITQAHTDQDFSETLERFDATCRAFNA